MSFAEWLASPTPYALAAFMLLAVVYVFWPGGED